MNDAEMRSQSVVVCPGIFVIEQSCAVELALVTSWAASGMAATQPV